MCFATETIHLYYPYHGMVDASKYIFPSTSLCKVSSNADYYILHFLYPSSIRSTQNPHVGLALVVPLVHSAYERGRTKMGVAAQQGNIRQVIQEFSASNDFM